MRTPAEDEDPFSRQGEDQDPTACLAGARTKRLIPPFSPGGPGLRLTLVLKMIK